MLRYRTQGLLAAGLGFVAACSDAEVKTDLRPDGPPDVLALLSQSQVDLLEDAVYCRYVGDTLDPKAPAFVGNPLSGGSLVCPPTKAEFDAAAPGASNFGFGLRIMFDELLNADRVETLDCDLDDDGVTDDPLICEGSLASTQPITITCTPTGNSAVTLDYTGYYVPNGNRVTFPVGPSIYALPDLSATAFPTGTPCNVTIKDSVVDKDNIAVDTAQRSIDFKLADLALVGTDPVDGNGSIVPPTGAAAFLFNAPLDDSSLDVATEVELTTAAGAAVDYDAVIDDGNASLDAIYVFTVDTWRPGDYIAKIKPGASFSEVNGGTIEFAAEEKVAFSVSFARIGTSPSASGTIAPNGTVTIVYNDPIKPESVTAEDFEFVDPTGAAVAFAASVVTVDAAIGNDAVRLTPSAPLTATTGTQRYIVRIKSAGSFESTGGKTARGPFSLSFKVM